MQALETIAKTREYLDYVERHINNVARAWEEVMAAMERGSYPISYDDFRYNGLREEVARHDMSKLSADEFVQYRRCFYPTAAEKEKDPRPPLGDAWEHHKKENAHHWENWTAADKKVSSPYDLEIHCTHMVIDWLAMSYEFGDTPRSYYEKNREKIELPEWAVKYITELFTDLEANVQVEARRK